MDAWHSRALAKGKPTPLFDGVAVALITHFNQDGGLDAIATAEHALELVNLGVSAIVIAGSTGEASALTAPERRVLLSAIRKHIAGKVPIVVGTGADSIEEAVALTAAARDQGADVVMALAPRGARDQRPYYDAVSKAAEHVPLFAYNWRTSPLGIPIELLGDLPILGYKESSSSVERLQRVIAGWGGPVYVGSSYLLLAGKSLGCVGAILSLANAAPELAIGAFNGDTKACHELMRDDFIELSESVIGIKALTARRFGTSTVLRLVD